MKRQEELICRVLTPDDYQISDWSGGQTTELLIGPEGSRYADRNFSFRISSATVDLPESTFTDLPDYNRIIMIFSGTMDLRHNDGVWMHFDECEPYRFDGADRTESRGKVTDFNLMLRKGVLDGAMVPLRMMPGETVNLAGVLAAEMGAPEEILVYCFKGHLTFTDGSGKTWKVGEKESFFTSGRGAGQGIRIEAEDGVVAAAAAVCPEKHSK